ncbi:MAG: enoyl-CoA hydratase/isomerase family protein [Chloroflexota bacterium]|nr:MAG: enoyl-CoA hydratase/isomerase family protein [Chloroflexota bacterium]
MLTLRLNQPEVRNALGSAMVRALHAALTRAGHDETVRAIIILGTGDAFSAGADLKTFLADDPPLTQALTRRELGALLLLIEAYRKPLVAAVNGDALGAGFGLVADADRPADGRARDARKRVHQRGDACRQVARGCLPAGPRGV